VATRRSVNAFSHMAIGRSTSPWLGHLQRDKKMVSGSYYSLLSLFSGSYNSVVPQISLNQQRPSRQLWKSLEDLLVHVPTTKQQQQHHMLTKRQPDTRHQWTEAPTSELEYNVRFLSHFPPTTFDLLDPKSNTYQGISGLSCNICQSRWPLIYYNLQITN